MDNTCKQSLQSALLCITKQIDLLAIEGRDTSLLEKAKDDILDAIAQG